jgi:cytochrome c556
MRVQFIVTVAVLLASIPTMSGHGEDAKDDVKALMKKKLESSQKVLEGLALNNFDTISKHAAELTRISKAAEFRVLKTPQYELYSNQFRRSVETMDEMAKAKNLDGAALAYVELTLTCVSCHKHVREVRMAMK